MKKFFKNTWPLWGIIIVAVVITIDLIIGSTSQPQTIPPELGEGAFAFYNGEWIGGDLVDDKIHLTNGTIMDFNEWKEIVGYTSP